MQKHYALTLKRLETFKSPLKSKIYLEQTTVKLSSFAAPGRITYDEAIKGDFKPLEIGHNFHPLWSTHWVKVEYQVPESWQGKEVHFLWDSMCEGEVWIDGKPMQGLTGATIHRISNVTRPEFILTPSSTGKESGVLYIEVAVNHLFGVDGGGPDVEHIVGWLRQAELAVFDREAWDLYWDFIVIADMARELSETTPRRGQALRIANQMIDSIRLDDRSTWPPVRDLAAAFFAETNGKSQHNLSAIGHAHIDTVWLWPEAETHRKCYRTFSTAIRYMDQYPDYKFVISQAQQWEWMKNEHPELYERMKEKVATGQLIPTGGSWVEMDANLPNGESFVRQFLFGQRFFEKELDFHCSDFWEPDVFGYSAALPQIMQLSEIDYFLTQKLSWNQFNKLDTHTFYWEGLDGSQVLAHFPPVDTYNSMANVKEVHYSVENYKDHESSKESYLPFGYGDGGGGPTMGMIEQLNRMKNIDGLPKVEMRSPKEFFKRLEEDLIDPVKWVGELYFELHRATYTTQALTKRNNRKCEFLLHDLEFIGALANLKHNVYPSDDLDWMWKCLLKNQFHDLIPGSSITIAYDEAAEEYAEILDKGTELRETALEGAFNADKEGENLLVVNTTSFAREEVVELPEGTPSAQTSNCGTPLGIVSAPAYGINVADSPTKPQIPVTLTETDDGFILENQYITAVITHGGHMTSLFDKQANREAMASGAKGNQFVIFEDRPAGNDAWDVDIYHLATREEVSPAYQHEVLEEGPYRASLSFATKISETSHINQIVRLSATDRMVEFITRVEWDESYRFLKVEFPFNVRSSEASYEIQFGHLKRPTHFNTSWDFARFEVSAHKWADLSEYDFGVSLLNDCKYGYSTLGNVMRLSLLRAPKHPDPVADIGSHRFNYAVMPHQGTLQESGVIAEGYSFNVPLQVTRTNAAPSEVSFFNIDHPGIVIETVKKAEDSDEIIIRMYESFGAQADAALSIGLPVQGAVEVNLLEHKTGEINVENHKIALHFTPFQIRTLKLKI